MPEDYYGEADMGGDVAPQQKPKAGGDKGEESEKDSGTKTALINSDICPGMKPGEEMVVKIERVLDSGEYEVSYAPEPEKKEEKPEEGGGEAQMAGAAPEGAGGGGMASLYE